MGEHHVLYQSVSVSLRHVWILKNVFFTLDLDERQLKKTLIPKTLLPSSVTMKYKILVVQQCKIKSNSLKKSLPAYKYLLAN